MERLLGSRLLPGLLLTGLVLAGCGDASSSDAATDPTGSSESPSATASGLPTGSPTKGAPGEYQTVAILSQTAAGGTVDPNAVRLDDPAAREEFVGQFENKGMDRKIEDAIASATVPSGYVLVGAVVAIGCDVPPGVDVTLSEDGYVLSAQEVASPLQECFAPVTSVAIVAVPG